jgi:ribosomal protein S27AE
MGDPACDRRFCPACDLAVTRADDACPECGASIEPRET